jgi:hypothetical protein
MDAPVGDQLLQGHAGHLADLVLDKRADLAAIELVAAVHQKVAHAHGALQLLGPVGHAADGRSGRGPDAQGGHLVQAAALHDGVGAVGGAQHGKSDVRRGLEADLGNHLVHGGLDAAHDVLGGGALGRGDQVQVAVDDHGVGIGAAHIDAQAPGALLLCHYRPPSVAASSSTGT